MQTIQHKTINTTVQNNARGIVACINARMNARMNAGWKDPSWVSGYVEIV